MQFWPFLWGAITIYIVARLAQRLGGGWFALLLSREFRAYRAVGWVAVLGVGLLAALHGKELLPRAVCFWDGVVGGAPALISVENGLAARPGGHSADFPARRDVPWGAFLVVAMISKALKTRVEQLKQKKYRKRHNAFLVEGGKSVLELLASGLTTERVFLTAEYADKISALPAAVPYELVSEDELTRLGTLATNTTALAIAQLPAEPMLLPPTNGLLLALDQVRDPGNVGTLIRLADWYGLQGVVCSDTCADPWAPKTVAATMGSFARVPIWQRDLPEWLDNLPPSVPRYGAHLEGDNVHRLTLQPAGVLIMGSESHGPRPEVLARLTQRLYIPGAGGAESLNVAISAAILLDNFHRAL